MVCIYYINSYNKEIILYNVIDVQSDSTMQISKIKENDEDKDGYLEYYLQDKAEPEEIEIPSYGRAIGKIEYLSMIPNKISWLRHLRFGSKKLLIPIYIKTSINPVENFGTYFRFLLSENMNDPIIELIYDETKGFLLRQIVIGIIKNRERKIDSVYQINL